MNTRTVEISAISADDLENVRKLGRRMRTYALLYTDNDFSQCVTTHVDGEGGCDPVWNDKLQLTLSKSSPMTLNIQIFCKTRYEKKSVGWSKVPLSEILDGFRAPHGLHCLSYRLKTKKGRAHGTIHFSLRFLHLNPPQFFTNSPISTTLPQQGSYQDFSGIKPVSARLIGVTMGYPSSSPFANANHSYHNIPLSVYPPQHHKQMYAAN